MCEDKLAHQHWIAILLFSRGHSDSRQGAKNVYALVGMITRVSLYLILNPNADTFLASTGRGRIAQSVSSEYESVE